MNKVEVIGRLRIGEVGRWKEQNSQVLGWNAAMADMLSKAD